MKKDYAIVADRILEDNEVRAEDVALELPGISFLTSEVKGMGTMNLPVVGLMDDMTMNITKVGKSEDESKLYTPGKHNFEIRFVQARTDENGVVSNVGCKAFVTVIPQEIAGASLEIGSAVESQHTYTVIKQQIFVNGEELLCIDRLNHILRFGGNDYYEEINNLL